MELMKNKGAADYEVRFNFFHDGKGGRILLLNGKAIPVKNLDEALDIVQAFINGLKKIHEEKE